jgi:hypothetical protein
MLPLKAHVQNGRLTLEEPTDLPKGEALHPVERLVAEIDDGRSDEELAELHQELEASIAEIDSGQGQGEDFSSVIAALRSPQPLR